MDVPLAEHGNGRVALCNRGAAFFCTETTCPNGGDCDCETNTLLLLLLPLFFFLSNALADGHFWGEKLQIISTLIFFI